MAANHRASPRLPIGKSLDCLTSHVSRLGTSPERRESGSHTHDRLDAQYMRDGRSKFVCLTESALPLTLESGERQRSHDADDTRLPSSDMIDDLSDDAHRIGRLSRFLKMRHRHRIPALPQQSSHRECDESSASDSEMSQSEFGDQDPLIPVGKSPGKIDSLGAQNGRSTFACLTEGALPRMINDSKLPSADMVQDLSDDAHSIGRSYSFSQVRHRVLAFPKRSSCLESDESPTSDSESSQDELGDCDESSAFDPESSQGELGDRDPHTPVGKSLIKTDCVTCHVSGLGLPECHACCSRTHDRVGAQNLRDGPSKFECLTEGVLPLMLDSGERPLVFSADNTRTQKTVEDLSEDAHSIGRLPRFQKVGHRSLACPQRNHESGSHTTQSSDSKAACVLHINQSLDSVSGEQPLVRTIDDTNAPSVELSARSYGDEDVAKFRKVNVTLEKQLCDESNNCTHDPLAAPTMRDDNSQLMVLIEDSIQVVLDSGERRPRVPNTDDKKTRFHHSGRHLKIPNARHRIPTVPEVNAILDDDLPGVSGSRTSDSVGAQRMCDGRSKFVCLTEDALPCILEDLHEEPLAHDTDDTKLPCAEMNEESSRGVSGFGRLARFLKMRRRIPVVPKQRPEIDNAVKIAREGILVKIAEFDEKKKIGRPMLEAGLVASGAGVVAAVGCCDGEQVVRKTPSMAREAWGLISSVASAITNS